ncbi:hypothetical protein HRE53_30690 (plasmid) [Acaryochloris sp. 'Moss Beach']|uniref:hypothetical protein n=1 Tax=Acaryochloris sp. 'Moss Beach' TaxID=2740837 RepID=UPI001F44AF69|nr:hypothetical protein [Acaryochloris sp. 'Moss Beach']UJB72953.1 hypothetical protein HRE53_30690 [Acaryochloris sp. 'Moss Beach']
MIPSQYIQNSRDKIVDVEVSNGRYAAVWRPGRGAQWWRSGMCIAQFKAQDKKYFNQGLRLKDVEIRNGKYTAFWQPKRGAQWWRSGLSISQFKVQDQQYFNQGLRLVDLEF